MTTGQELLMIFVKNPVHGKVKTRLTKTIGAEKAFGVYQQLLVHTHRVTQNLLLDKGVYHLEEAIADDACKDDGYQKTLQEGSDPGKRMLNVFRNAFQRGHMKVYIIGSDVFIITQEIIPEAFDAMPKNCFVIAPTHDGSNDFIGMTALNAALFKNKKWSSHEVLHDTPTDLRHMSGSYRLLPEFTDVDKEEDLVQSGHLK